MDVEDATSTKLFMDFSSSQLHRCPPRFPAPRAEPRPHTLGPLTNPMSAQTLNFAERQSYAMAKD